MQERVAIITGGMGGLGETISTKMADAGYRVVVTYSPSNKTSDKWLAAMQEKGFHFSAYACDVTDFHSSKACVERVTGEVGPVDILVAKAGMHGFTKSLALESARKGVTVNTISPGYIGTKMVTAIPSEVLQAKILP